MILGLDELPHYVPGGWGSCAHAGTRLWAQEHQRISTWHGKNIDLNTGRADRRRPGRK